MTMRVCDRCGKKLGFGSYTVTTTQITFPYLCKKYELCSKCMDGITKSITRFEENGQEGE